MNEFILHGINGSLISVAESRKRNDNYFWEESYIDVDHLTFLMNDYILNIDLLEEKKQQAIKYSRNNFNWNKNSISLLEIVKQVKKRNISNETFEKVTRYEKSRGIKFYLANMLIYSKFKKGLKYFLTKK